MEFSRQEYWSRLSFPSAGNLPDQQIKPMCSALAGGFLTTEHMESQIGRLLAYILKISQKLDIEKFEDVESLYVCAYKIYIMYICAFGDKI